MDATLPALDGLLVADFSRVLAGPMATMMLADMGARVIKVERPEVGDETRQWGPPFTEDGTTYFESVNRSKESIALDLTDDDDLGLARELVDRADVVIHNFRPGTMERIGLGHREASGTNPGLVYCSISGFGEDAGRDLPGYDFVVQAASGLMGITGNPGEPSKVGVALVDVLTGKDAVIGILAALNARERTGRGDHVRVSLLSSSLAAMVNQGQAALATGRAPRSMGNRHPSIAPYETLACADGMLAVACGNDGQFARLAAVLGTPELAGDPRFATNTDRVAHRDELVEQLEGLLAAGSMAQWEQLLAEQRVPARRVGSVLDGIALATELGLEPTVEVGRGGRQIRHPIDYRNATVTEPSEPPTLGQHSQELRRWLSS